MTKDIQKWADTAMFKAQEQPADGPRVYLLSCNNDPLGSIAAAAKAYKGEFVESLAQITDEERRYYLEQVQKSVLAMPLEAVNFHFRITGVTRGFTHQMVRQRTAAYSQESTRFAVKETVPVGRPPSLDGTLPWHEYLQKCYEDMYPGDANKLMEKSVTDQRWANIHEWAETQASDAQTQRRVWDDTVKLIEHNYNLLVDMGMPAEDARGLLPTNLLTQLNYFTNLRNYKEEAGKRLCTQAQFEWRIVFSKMMEAIREYGKTQIYRLRGGSDGLSSPNVHEYSSAWQFDALADLFRPICYYRGSCQFQADFDRHCTIRGRVEENAAINRPSTEWDKPGLDTTCNDYGPYKIDPIFPAEWLLDPSAARVRA